MWTREMLKTNAKNVLRKNYWNIFVAVLIFGILGGAGGNSSSGIFSGFSSYSSSLSHGNAVINEKFVITMAVIILVVTAVVSILGSALTIFVGNVINVGLRRYLLKIRQQDAKADIGELFWAFKGGRYLKVVKTMFFYNLYIFLWSLLFIIPGIIKTYEYYYVPYILAENPDIETRRVLELSKEMTDGEKMDIWVLGLSFIGWTLLGMLPCGIGVMFLNPYIWATDAELYAFSRTRSIQNSITDSNELTGLGEIVEIQQDSLQF